MVDFDDGRLAEKVGHFVDVFGAEQHRWKKSAEARETNVKKRRKSLTDFVSREIKWTSELEVHVDRSTEFNFELENIRGSVYRPFVKRPTYFARIATHRVYRQDAIFPIGQPAENVAIGFSGCSSSKPFQTFVVDDVPSYDLLEKTQFLPLRRLEGGGWVDNITDWALKQFKDRYTSSKGTPPQPSPSPVAKGREQGAKRITKLAIFHYVYAVLHDPLYREKYVQNLKREFPRIPFYDDFWQWAAWGEQLMALHLGYETLAPWPLTRADTPDGKALANGAMPKAMLKADKDNGRIVLDSETTLAGIPPEAWAYRLGNRSALEWILDQYKEKKPKDPTIREKFNTYRFADHKEKVVDLLLRVTRVSVDTQAIVEAMRATSR